MTTKPHVSPTQLEMFAKCPESYRRRYVEGEKIPPGIAATVGRGVHAGAAVNFRQKRESHQDLPTADIIDAAVEAYNAGIHEGIGLSAEELSRGSKVVIAEGKDATRDFAALHALRQAPDYQPDLVEEMVRIDLPNASHDLLGIIDLADDRARVIDLKTGAKKKSQSDADDSVQLTTYAAAFKARTGFAPSQVLLDVGIRTKTGKTDRQVLTSDRSQADFAALSARVNAMLHALQAGAFPPTTPGAWWCGERWCGFWSSCPYVNSERKAAAEAVA